MTKRVVVDVGAIARVRALELGLDRLQATTIGVSGLLTRTGTDLEGGLTLSVPKANAFDFVAYDDTKALTSLIVKGETDLKLNRSAKATGTEAIDGVDIEKWVGPYALKQALNAKIVEVAASTNPDLTAIQDQINDRMEADFGNAVFDPTGATGAAKGDLSNVAESLKLPTSYAATENYNGDPAFMGGYLAKGLVERLDDPTPVTALGGDLFVRKIQYLPNYTGGTPFFVSSAFYLESIVGANVSNFVFGGVSYLENNATGGQNAAFYMRNVSRPGAGPSFAAVSELSDDSGGNPAAGRVAHEFDVWGVGGDADNRRVGAHIVTGKAGRVGSLCETGVGLWITPFDNDFSEGRFKRAIAVDADVDIGLDLSGATSTTGGVMIRLAAAAKFAWQATNERLTYWQDGAWYWQVGASNVAGVSDSGLIFSETALRPGVFTVATVPSASSLGAGAAIFVTDEVGGAVPAFSDGTNWRRVTDRSIIS